jgi:hypothetical protein
MPADPGFLPEALVLPFLTQHISKTIVSYADAAALMLAHVTPHDEMSHHRVGLAVPVDMQHKRNSRPLNRKFSPPLISTLDRQ